MITLINGPYNGREIEDSGADPIRMGIYDHTKPPGVHIGVAIYRRFPPLDPAGGQAFWDGNEWQGELVETIKP
jgi:hypothetical protein